MIIKIWKTDQADDENDEQLAGTQGYMYDIWKGEEEEAMENDSDDGGLCTGTEADALGMAYEQAKELLKNKQT